MPRHPACRTENVRGSGSAAVSIRALVGTVQQELLEQVAVRTVQFHAVESRLQGKFGAATELLDNRLDLIDLEHARHDQFRFDDTSVRVTDSRMFERAQCRRRNRRQATRVGRMRLTTRVPHLEEDARPLACTASTTRCHPRIWASV